MIDKRQFKGKEILFNVLRNCLRLHYAALPKIIARDRSVLLLDKLLVYSQLRGYLSKYHVMFSLRAQNLYVSTISISIHLTLIEQLDTSKRNKREERGGSFRGWELIHRAMKPLLVPLFTSLPCLSPTIARFSSRRVGQVIFIPTSNRISNFLFFLLVNSSYPFIQ